MAGERLTLPSGDVVIGYTAGEVDNFGDTIDRAEAFAAAWSGPCRTALDAVMTRLTRFWDTLQANTIYTRDVPRIGARFPEDLVGGSWLAQDETQALAEAFADFAVEQRECEEMDDPGRWVSDPPDPPDTDTAAEMAAEPLSIGGVSGGSSSSGLLMGLGVAATVIGLVWIIMKGKR
jgi:hypothetical protein